MTVIPITFGLSLMGTADAVAIAFYAWGMRWLLCLPARPLLVGLMCSAAVSTKIVVGIWFFPSFAAAAISLCIECGYRQCIFVLARCVGWGIVGLAILNPYLWIDPLRSVKSVIGNIVQHSTHGVSAFNLLNIPVDGTLALSIYIGLSVTASLACLRLGNWRLPGFTLCIVMAAILGFFLNNGFDYWRYLAGATVPAVIVASILIVRREHVIRSSGILAVALSILLAFSAFEVWTVRQEPGLRDIVKAMGDACARGETIWVDAAIVSSQYDRLPLPISAIKEIAAYTESAERSDVAIGWLEQQGIAPAAAVALQTAFTEYEQTSKARWRGLSIMTSEAPACDLHLFNTLPPNQSRGSLVSTSIVDLQEALRRDRQTQQPIMVVGETKVLTSLGLPTYGITKSGWWATSVDYQHIAN
jgi:hypothetical protein